MMNLNKLYGTRINNGNTRKTKRIYQREGRNHFNSFLGKSMKGVEEKVTDRRNCMEAWM